MSKSKTTKTTQRYQVTVNGKTFTRQSARTYTHAIVARADEAKARARAEHPTAQDLKTWRANFEHLGEFASGAWHARHGFTLDESDRAKMPGYAAEYARGWEAFLADTLARERARLDAEKARGLYAWHVVGWAGSEKLARAQVQTHRHRGAYRDVTLVPAGATVTLPEE